MWAGLAKLFKGLVSRRGRRGEPSFTLPDNTVVLREMYTRTQEIEGPGGAITAREAYDLAAEIIRLYDTQARLTGLESTAALLANGQCHSWRFTFHLPARWAEAIFFFRIGEPDRLTVELRPFVEPGSALASMMDEGKNGFVEQQWKVELERHRALATTFPDSPDVLAGYLKGSGAGVPVDAVLRAFTPPLGKSRWELLESKESKKSLYSFPIE